MREAIHLMRDAALVYDDPAHDLAGRARSAARAGFRGGAEWMRAALGVLRGRAPEGHRSFTQLGVLKYGACTVAALVPAALAWVTGSAWWLLAALPAFYAVEASLVFAFPAALDGAESPFAASRALVARAGGVIAAMGTVSVLATVMLFGGLGGRGIVRSWCLGCLAVLLWYEHARTATESAKSLPKSRNSVVA